MDKNPDADGNIPEVYPMGFNPIEDTSITDFTFDNGLKFKVADWDVDFYNAFGNNRFTYDITNTINATLGVNLLPILCRRTFIAAKYNRF
jgi:iron complex outermembrane receptor protein